MSKEETLVQKLVERYGTENPKAALAAQAVATLLGEDEQVLFDMIEEADEAQPDEATEASAPEAEVEDDVVTPAP